MENTYFLHQVKHTSGSFDKGIVIKETFEAAKQGFHAYLGAYAYGQHTETDFVSCMITDLYGVVLMSETWMKAADNTAE